jgi:hypothetical protein
VRTDVARYRQRPQASSVLPSYLSPSGLLAWGGNGTGEPAKVLRPARSGSWAGPCMVGEEKMPRLAL